MASMITFPQPQEFVSAFVERENELGNSAVVVRELQGEGNGVVTKLVNVVSGTSMWRFHQDYFVAEGVYGRIHFSAFALVEAQLLMAHCAGQSVVTAT